MTGFTQSEAVNADFFQVQGNPGGTEESYNIIIEKNFFYDNQSQIGNLTCAYDAPRSANVRDWTFRNNVFILGNGSCFVDMNGVNFYNNTFYHTDGSSGIHILVYSTGNTATIKNNLFIGGSDSGEQPDTYGWYGGGTLTADYNYVAKLDYSAKTGFTGEEANGISGGDPKFSNTSGTTASSFSLTADAPTNVGVDLSATFTTDYAGTTRNAPWNIGAYEYSGTSPTGTHNGISISGGVSFR
jgi:hypothetical protein